jgi:hypothetical protein
MSTEYLDVRINTKEGIPIQFRVPIDTATRDRIMQLHVTDVELIHTLSHVQMQGMGLPKVPPCVSDIDKFKIGG